MNKLQITNYKLKIKHGGFTVLESIVAIFILSLSISGGFAAVQQSLAQANIAKDEVKAFYLAQEAIEIIKNKRDNNQLVKIKTDSGNWLDGITTGSEFCPFSTASNKNTCKISATSMEMSLCGAGDWGSCPDLRQDPVNYYYGYNGSWPASNFKREIQIERIRNDSLGDAAEIAVTVRISWMKGLVSREFKVKTYLLKWI